MGRAPARAAQHGLSAVVADELARRGAPVPPGVAADARAQVAAGLRTRSLTLAVIDALARRGVVPVVLKGLALAARLFPEQPLGRPSTDVDIFVGRDQLELTTAAMVDLGLEPFRDPGLEDAFEEHHHVSFHRQSALVEVHFRLYAGFGGGLFDDAAVLQRCRSFTLEGRPVRLLAPEDEVLYLAVHAASHAFLRLSWLVDLQRYLELVLTLDWRVMGQRAREAGFFVAVATTLQLLEALMGVQLPPAATSAFRLGQARSAVNRLLFSRDRVVAASLPSHHLAGFLLRFWLVDSPAHGVRHLVDGARRFRRRRRSGV